MNVLFHSKFQQHRISRIIVHILAKTLFCSSVRRKQPKLLGKFPNNKARGKITLARNIDGNQ